MYGDCGASDAIFNSLYSATPAITLKIDTATVGQLVLSIEESGTDVSPVCTREINNTKCHEGTLPGVRRFKYSNTVTLPTRSSKWVFLFTGNMGATTQAGRSGSITNIVSPLGFSTVMQLEADLDNSVVDNSSPDYSSIPTPFYCINVVQQYNQGAIDADGDSLAFSLVSAFDANTNNPVNYSSPYSGSSPLATTPGSFSFSSLNGQISFTPSIIQDALVVCKVDEYRNGVLIGTSEREMTFVVLDNCQGTPPITKLNAVSGGSITGANVVNICVGSEHLSFGIALTNPDGDNTNLSATTLPGGSTLNFVNNNTSTPYAIFDWATAGIPIGVYTFYLTVQNDHCPLANRQTVAFTINVTPFPEISYKLITPTQCLHKAVMEYDMKFGYTPRTLTIFQGSNVYKKYTDSTGVITDSIPFGNYTVTVSSNDVCTTTSNLAVSDSGDLPLNPIVRDYCLNGPSSTIDVGPIGEGAIITWFYEDHSLIFYPPKPDTKKLGTVHWYFTEQYQHCISTFVPVTTTVHPLPVPKIADSSMPSTICIGDTIYLKASGGTYYTWTPADQVMKDSAGNEFIRVISPVNIQLKAADIYGCADSITHQYKDLQYCCLFSYPNAFTPNKDGKNDGFRIISYGNLTEYNLLIFNRWGQQVFQTNDPREYWDGTFGGVPCDMGTYYYYFKAQCLTGNKEESKGDVILIR